MIGRLPGQLDLLKRTAKAITNPLFRFLEREVTVTSGLLDAVRDDLNAVLELCKGIRK
jgi:dynein heavy chain 1